MTDNFQSKPIVKPPKDAKTVAVKSDKNSTDVVSAASINETALSFIRAWKRQRAAQG